MKCNRNSVGVEIDDVYLQQARKRAERETCNLFQSIDLHLEDELTAPSAPITG